MLKLLLIGFFACSLAGAGALVTQAAATYSAGLFDRPAPIDG